MYIHKNEYPVFSSQLKIYHDDSVNIPKSKEIFPTKNVACLQHFRGGLNLCCEMK